MSVRVRVRVRDKIGTVSELQRPQCLLGLGSESVLCLSCDKKRNAVERMYSGDDWV